MRFDLLAFISTPICACVLVLSGCGGTQIISSSSANPSGPAPTVVGLGDQVNGVAPNRAQEVQFSEAMDPTTINSQSFQVADSSGKPMQGKVSYDPDFNTAIFQPSPALLTNANYTATITTAAASSGGVHLASPYTFAFDTRSTTDTSPLLVNSVSPAANATCVSTTMPIVITFDEAPDPSTVTPGNFMVSGPGGVITTRISLDVTTTQVVITPTTALPSGTITVNVNNVADLAGVKMSAPYSWTFSTACNSVSSVAYVYVTSEDKASVTNQIVAYAADASGQLTPVPGSPFNQNVGVMAATSAYLVAGALNTATGTAGSVINTYSIGSNGALTLGPQFDDSQIDSQIASEIRNGSQYVVTCGMGVQAFDRSGQSLYADVGCTDGSNHYARIASFAFDSANGTLSYLGNAATGDRGSNPSLPFLGNDAFAYHALSTGCGTFVGGGTFSFARGSNGLLSAFPTVMNWPPTPSGATRGVGPFGYVEGLAATDTTNHVAFTEDACFFLGGANQPVQLATYTANSDGSLTTSDTHDTMPSTSINPIDLEMSPSGTQLAVAGSGGLQIFHFNGASPITSFTGILTTDFIDRLFWDHSNHLYALSPAQGGPNSSGLGKLHVFTVTDTGAAEAPGSPYIIQNPGTLTVSSQR